MPTAMIALGGNSISQKGEAGEISSQFTHTRQALEGISHFINRNYNLCINHGNGPQVGNELYRMELTQNKIPSLPLGICVAATQGTIGYMIQQSLQNKLRNMDIDREVVTLISQVIVNNNDVIEIEPIKVDKVVDTKIKKAQVYNELFSEHEDILQVPLVELNGIQNHYWVYGIIPKVNIDRNLIMSSLHDSGIETRPFFYPLNKLHYDFPQSLPQTHFLVY